MADLTGEELICPYCEGHGTNLDTGGPCGCPAGLARHAVCWIPGKGDLTGTWVEARLVAIDADQKTAVLRCPDPFDDPCPIERPLSDVRFEEPEQ